MTTPRMAVDLERLQADQARRDGDVPAALWHDRQADLLAGIAQAQDDTARLGRLLGRAS